MNAMCIDERLVVMEGWFLTDSQNGVEFDTIYF